MSNVDLPLTEKRIWKDDLYLQGTEEKINQLSHVSNDILKYLMLN